jgi:ABC-type sulfate/molybdate transport systems ATPase subunit
MATPDVATALLKANSISLERGGRSVLKNLNLEIHAGSGPFAIIGESGSGKTTLLHCACGLSQPDTGLMTLLGEKIDELSPAERATRVGLVFQDYQLFPHLSVRENIALAPAVTKLPARTPSIDNLLVSLRIGELADRRPHELSGGQKQRVAIARSLILEPRILFLDEPSAALDERTTLELAELLKELNHRVQIIVVSHDRLFVEACCDRGVRIKDGKASEVKAIDRLFSEEF